MPDAFDPVAFLSRLIGLESPDPPGREIDVAEAVHAEMTRLGISSTLDAFQPGRANVIGRVPGGGRRRPLVFSAHLDTTPIGRQPWSFDPFAGDVVDGRIRGRGASDMKGAVSAFIAAAARLAARPTPLAGDVILAFTAGESSNCLGARRLVEQGFQ
jgi:succinyl-diaminopimelate desuccinylase